MLIFAIFTVILKQNTISESKWIYCRRCPAKSDTCFSLTNEGTRFYFQTTLNAPKRRVVAYDLSEPEKVCFGGSLPWWELSLTSVRSLKGFFEIIPESEDVLNQVNVIDDNKLVLVYLHDVKVSFSNFRRSRFPDLRRVYRTL